ncbi:phage tail tube protein [Tistrella bauzanensis]|uniref:phage tail tube protein n=1 Tax=Tistrella TaxID=171436 RepID=UPI0031F670C7
MAYDPPREGKLFVCYVGDQATPTEAFDFVCGTKQSEIAHNNNSYTSTAVDCADPTGSEVIEYTGMSHTSTSITMSGDSTAAGMAILRPWMLAKTSRNVKAGYRGEGYYSGAFRVSSLTEGGQTDSGFVTVSVSLARTGAETWVADETFGVVTPPG